MIRLATALATLASVTALTFAEDHRSAVHVVAPIKTLSWQTPGQWIQLVSGDEKDILSPRVMRPELAPPARESIDPNLPKPQVVPDIPMQPVPDSGLPSNAIGQPNSNLPPQIEANDPDYSEVENADSESPQNITPPTQPVISEPLENGSLSNGYRFDSGDGCGESCGRPMPTNSCFRCLSDDACNVFTVYTGAAFLHRIDSKAQRLIVNPANPAQNLNAGDFDFGMEAGIEIGATGHGLFGEMDLDMRYFSVGEFSDHERRRTTGNVTRIEAGQPVNFSGPRSIMADYRSDLSSFEAGLQYRVGAANDWTTFWIGLRVLNFGESLTGSLVSPVATQPTQNLSVDVSNLLVGLQVGMNETILGDCRHSLEGYWRAGIYGNGSSNNIRLIAQNTPPTTIRSGGSGGQTSFVGEIGLKGKLRLTNNLNLYGRYQILFAEGVALAGEQVAANSLLTRSGHSTNGGLFYHGAVLGLEYAY